METTLRQVQEENLTLAQRLEQAHSIDTRMERYIPFLAITKDDNPIHTDEDYAVKTPFEGIVVPGLYLALMAEGNMPRNIAGIDLTFKSAVRPGDDIKFLDEAGETGRVGWYRMNGGDPKLTIDGRIRFNNDPKQAENMVCEDEEGVKTYESIIREGDIANMLKIARMIDEPSNALKMHSAGYISPALLMFSGNGFTGAYAKQKFFFHSALKADERFKVLARISGEREVKGQKFVMFEYSLLGNDSRPVVTGTALVAEVKYGHS